MTIRTATDMRDWDRYTMLHEPIAAIDLMERAAHACTVWISDHLPTSTALTVLCGRGNNGGDGLALARQLKAKGYPVQVFVLETGSEGSPDFKTNLERWKAVGTVEPIASEKDFPPLDKAPVVVDALFGYGLNKPLTGLAAALANHINKVQPKVIAIDLPSGLFADTSSKDQPVISAQTTLTFQAYKLGLLLAENGPVVGKVVVLDIGLHSRFAEEHRPEQELITPELIAGIYRPRKPYAHKGSFGHALLLAGSYGKIGAAVLSARACLRSGAGLLTVALPRCGYVIMQTALPEAMVIPDTEEEHLTQLPEEINKYGAIGLGPGMGTEGDTQALIATLLEEYHQPLVIDADALNCLSKRKHWLDRLPALSIITPHPKEFDRLFGEQPDEAARIKTAKAQARDKKIVIVLKGAHTLVATPEGHHYFNTTGNAGMAKGGSGDVLTGIITALVAQHYTPAEAAILGVYLHGLAGDEAARKQGQEAMTATDLTDFLGAAFLKLTHQFD